MFAWDVVFNTFAALICFPLSLNCSSGVHRPANLSLEIDKTKFFSPKALKFNSCTHKSRMFQHRTNLNFHFIKCVAVNLMIFKIDIRVTFLNMIQIFSFVRKFLTICLNRTYLSMNLFQLNLFTFHVFARLVQPSVTESSSSCKFGFMVKSFHFIG